MVLTTKYILGVCCTLLCGLSGFPQTARPSEDGDAPLVVFAVRHAEKVDASRDPELSLAGEDRAQELAGILQHAGIQQIHSSDYLRTRNTAQPIADRLGLELEIYDARKLTPLIAKLRQTGGRHLVVGHSNTTPAVVRLLGGEPGTPIEEAGEYDRLYVVTVDANGQSSTVLMRYGQRFDEPTTTELTATATRQGGLARGLRRIARPRRWFRRSGLSRS